MECSKTCRRDRAMRKTRSTESEIRALLRRWPEIRNSRSQTSPGPQTHHANRLGRPGDGVSVKGSAVPAVGPGFRASNFGSSARAWFLLLAALAPVLLCGCKSGAEDAAMQNAFFLTETKDLGALGRVALVELDNTSDYPQIAAEVTQALYLETQKQQLFSVALFRRDDPAWRSLQDNLSSLEAMRKLQAIRETLRSNGLLLGTITEYQPYPHMVIGLRLTLMDLTDGQPLWGLEQIWDSADKSIQKRVKKYFHEQLRSGHAPLNEELVVVSSLNFCKFVAYEVAATLQRPKER